MCVMWGEAVAIWIEYTNPDTAPHWSCQSPTLLYHGLKVQDSSKHQNYAFMYVQLCNKSCIWSAKLPSHQTLKYPWGRGHGQGQTLTVRVRVKSWSRTHQLPSSLLRDIVELPKHLNTEGKSLQANLFLHSKEKKWNVTSDPRCCKTLREYKMGSLSAKANW